MRDCTGSVAIELWLTMAWVIETDPFRIQEEDYFKRLYSRKSGPFYIDEATLDKIVKTFLVYYLASNQEEITNELNENLANIKSDWAWRWNRCIIQSNYGNSMLFPYNY